MASGENAAVAPANWEAIAARLAGSSFAAVVVAMHVAPRGGWLYLAILTAILFGLLLGTGWRVADSHMPTLPAIGLLAFGAFALASELWAAVPGEAIRSGGIFVVQTGLAIVAADAIARLPEPIVRQLGLGLLFGFAIGLGFVLVEAVSKLALHRLVYAAFPTLTPGDDQYFQFKDGRLAAIDASYLKRNMAASSLLLWPVLALAANRAGSRVRPVLLPVILLATAIAATLAGHESSVVAIAASAAVFAAAQRWYAPTWRAVAAIWSVLTLLIVPIMLLEFHAKVYDVPWIQMSSRDRLVIWGYSAEQVLQAPVLGIGAGSGHILDARRTDKQVVPGTSFVLNTANHQHDVFLQAWYELGGLGAALLWIAGLLGLWRLARLPATVRAIGLATFTAAAAMVSTSYGLWQEWFEASLLISAVALALAIRTVAAPALAPSRKG